MCNFIKLLPAVVLTITETYRYMIATNTSFRAAVA